MTNTDLIVEERKVGPLTVRVEYDDSGANDPREWDDLGLMVGTSSTYLVGDVQQRETDDSAHGYGCVENWLIATYDAERSTIRRFYVDGAEAGWHFVTPKGIANCGTPPELWEEVLDQDERTYNSFLEGDVYGWVVLGQDGEPRDSCWGYIGEPDYAMTEGVASAEGDPRYRAWLGLQSACRGEGI